MDFESARAKIGDIDAKAAAKRIKWADEFEPKLDKAETRQARKAPLAGGAPGTATVPGVGEVPAFEQGGDVTATGLALVHEGESIIPRSHQGSR